MTSFLQYCVNTLGYLRLMTVSDLIDIAILSFLFYKCIGIFQRTNAAKVAKALLLIIVAMWISYQFNLNAISFILNKAVELGLLALVVIFQPEIRRFLERIGSNNVSRISRFFRNETPVSDVEEAIQETVEAYGEMSKNRVGALMVFERETNLSNIISSGTPFQSTVTSELLKNIFYPNAPLHDGAVVVRQGKIAAAACMLPMSESMNLSKDLGMRHRAGLGMSERSDAVVAIVSEETGAISVVVNGNLRRHLSPETLGRILRNELLPREESASGKRRRPSLPFWKGRGGESTEQNRDHVSLKLSGRKKTLMKLNRKNITLKLDVSSVTSEGEHTLSCKVDFPDTVGDNVSISDWEDPHVTVTVEKQATKEIPVRGEFIGTEADNCLAGAVTTDPETLVLKGPEKELEGISYALATVGGKEVRDTIVEQSSVVFMGPDGTPASRKNVTASAESVEVTVPVRQVVSLPLTVEIIEGGGAAREDVEVTISPETITVVAQEGEEALPSAISLGTIELEDVLGDTSYSFPIKLPAGVTAWGEQSRYARVSLTFPQLVTRQLAVEQIALQNIPQGYDAALVSKQLYVWVRGRQDLVEALDPNQLQVEVDLSEAGKGDELQRFPAKVTWKGGEPEGVKIMGTHYSVALRLKQ